MSDIAIISSIMVSIIAIIYALLLIRAINKKPSGSKKMADAAKIIADERSGKKKYQNMALAVIVLFTGLLYAFSWAPALGFLAGAIIFAAADYLIMIFIGKAEIRMAEASKTGARETFSLGFNSANAGGLISSAAALLVATVIYIFAGSGLPLWGLALATIITTTFTWQKNDRGLFAAYVTALVVALVFANRYFPDSKDAQVFPLAIFSLGLLATIISSWFAGVGKKTADVFAAIVKGLAAMLVIFLAASYFIVKLMLPGSGKSSVLVLFLLLAGAAIVASSSIIFSRRIVILPLILTAAAIFLVNFAAGTNGILLLVVGIAGIIPLAIAYGYFFNIARSAEIISQSTELPEVAQRNLAVIGKARISTKNFAVLASAVAVLATLLIFSDKFAAGQFTISNLKLISGFLTGGALAYYFSAEVFADEITPLAISVILPILAGLIFGPVFLVGALAGVILTNLLLKNINEEVLTLGIVSVLTVQFIENLYDLKIRLIILAAVVVAVAIYLIVKKLYENREKSRNKKIADSK